ncbi:hypothetical protein [Streptomyces iconiensis]|uniref:Uncharacterized protein n=1 Tax=Streptomyces iconiensis TaxID=1384038 RepID=A0ABT6ZRU3_9ACTN|nr:hypothetical protein [Streptomyces iconiensis]MDJ1131781.1 hypothetical protein [Streptomyces iconiensis]
MNLSPTNTVHRPTEETALRRAATAARPLPPVEQLLDALVMANRRGDRAGMCLCAHRAVRAAGGEVGEP